MKTKIDIKKIKGFLIDLIMASFFAGGWVLFIFSEINKQEEITKEIKRQTKETREAILNLKRDTVFTTESTSIISRDDDLIEELIAKLNSANDSLSYYKAFKELVSRKVAYNYDFKNKGSYVEYFISDVHLIKPPVYVDSIKIDTSGLIDADTIQ